MPTEGSIRSKRGSAALAETKEIPLDRVNGTPIAIDGETAIVGKLSIVQIAALARTALMAAVRMTPDERARVFAAAQSGQIGDMAVLFVILDAPTITSIFSIILDRPEDWCGKHIGALETLEIADAVLENNRWEQMQAVFFRLKTRLPPSLMNSARPSPPSPVSDSPSEPSETTPSNGSNE